MKTVDRGPEMLKEILARVFTARGWGRRQERLQLEEAWAAAAGSAFARQTQVGNLRRGVLEVIVSNAVLMQELASFHKRQLLEELQKRVSQLKLTDLRFRAGSVKPVSGER